MDYDCIGICQPAPTSGLCEGCGRPYFEDAPDASLDEAIPAFVAPILPVPTPMAQTTADDTSSTTATPCSSS